MISDGVAYEVTRILEENVQYGTGIGAGYRPDAAGKTGTTEEHSDAWFCGYTPRLSTTVWVGYPKAKIPMENVHGIAVAGGTFPAEIWRLFMSSALGGSTRRVRRADRLAGVDDFERGTYGRSFGYSDEQASGYVAPETTETTDDGPTPPTAAAAAARRTGRRRSRAAAAAAASADPP